MDPPANLSYFTLSTPAPGETNRSSFDAADPRPNLPPALCLRGACPDLAGLPGGGHVRLEPAGAGDHSPRAHIPPRSTQLDGVYGHLGRAGSRSGHTAEPGARAVRAPLAAGPAAVPAVDRVRCALLHGQLLERDGHRAGPLLVHHPSPGIHAARPQARLQRHDRAHLGALRRHLLGPAALRLGRDLLGGQRGVPGEPRALLHVFSTVGAFYLLLGVVFFVYWKIYKAAKLRVGPRKTNSVSPISETVQVKGAAQRPERVLATRRATVPFQADRDAQGEQKEQRAALMVGILIGVFALCWIPFFTSELLSPLRACDGPATWKSAFLWLGYSNSFLNPPIYMAFNKNYNSAFKNLFSRHR